MLHPMKTVIIGWDAYFVIEDSEGYSLLQNVLTGDKFVSTGYGGKIVRRV